jgi:hypothetical protein
MARLPERNKLRVLDPEDDAAMDLFNEKYTQVCEALRVPRETLEISYAQAMRLLQITMTTLQRYVYSKPPVIRHGAEKATVVLDDVVQRMTQVRR